MAQKFPRAYTSEIDVDRGLMEYVRDFHKMDIGARLPQLSNQNLNELKALEHVGKDGSRGEAKAAK
jgi:hypothetical protein